MNYENLLNTIRMNVYSNGSELITGDVLQGVLNDMVDSVASGYLFKGLAQPTTNPGTPDENVAYVAGPGTYPHFGSLVVPEGYLGVLKYNGTWAMDLVENTSTMLTTVEEGFFVVDSNYNIGLSLTGVGLMSKNVYPCEIVD